MNSAAAPLLRAPLKRSWSRGREPPRARRRGSRDRFLHGPSRRVRRRQSLDPEALPAIAMPSCRLPDSPIRVVTSWFPAPPLGLGASPSTHPARRTPPGRSRSFLRSNDLLHFEHLNSINLSRLQLSPTLRIAYHEIPLTSRYSGKMRKSHS